MAGGKQKIKRFFDKGYADRWSPEDPYNPSFGRIDRVLDEGEAGDDIFLLIKWQSLSYDQATWTHIDLANELDKDRVDLFYARRFVPDIKKKSVSFKRPDIDDWEQLTESPRYKDGNTLRSYQLEGLNWLLYCYHNNQNSILADEMGLGKTVQSTSFINHLFTAFDMPGPFLIVTPLSTIGNWEREIVGWTDLNVVVYHGNDKARNLIVDTEFYYRDAKGGIIPNAFKFDVILTTYEMAISGSIFL